MYDPVLNRPMFQGSSSTAQGPSTPSAKGTGITSMVTAPDQGAQQLRSFANPTIQPTIRGFADGGFLGGGQSSPLPEGPMSGNPIQTAVSQAVDQAVINPVPNFANGGPVQHFQEGGLSSIFSRFADSLKEGGGEASMAAPDVSGPDEYQQSRDRIVQQKADKAAADRAELFRITQQEEERLANSPPGFGPGYSTLPPPGIYSVPPKPQSSVREFENPYVVPESDRDNRARIEKMEGPRPMPPTRPPEERSSISTELNKIREDRKAQSAADRRENALMALMSAGFGMAAGKSRHALANIGEGGQQGIATFANLEKSRREDDNRRYLADLHERELRMNEPYKQAMTQQAQAQAEYLKARPGIEADKIAARERYIVSRAEADAQKAIDAIESKNPMAYYSNGKPDALAKDIAKSKYLQQYKRMYQDQYRAGVPTGGNGLDLQAPE